MNRALLHALIGAITLAAIYPILVVIGISLRPAGALYSTSLSLIPPGASLEAYRVVLFEKPFGRWLLNSSAVSLLVTIGGVALASTAGYAFSGWLNAVTTDDLIKAAQANRFVGMDSSLSFDGLTAGAELRF